MANERREPVHIKPFKAQPILADGNLPVAYKGGDLERTAAAAFYDMADHFRAINEREKLDAGVKDGEAAALAALPKVSVSGNDPIMSRDTAVPAPSGKVQDRAGAYKRYLMRAHNLTNEQASAAIGRAIQESSLNIGAVGDKGTAYGLFQWRNERLQALKTYAGDAMTNPYRQLDFFVHEMKTAEKSAGQKFFGSKDLAGAAEAMMDYERPRGWTAGNSRGGHGWANTIGHATRLMAKNTDMADLAQPDPKTPVNFGRQIGATPLTLAATGGGFKPLEGHGAYVDAYNKAGAAIYKTALLDEMLSAGSQLATKYENDPDGLELAMADLHKQQVADHVPPAMMAEYEVAFRKMRNGYVNRAMADAREKEKAQIRDRFDAAGQQLANRFHNAAARVDPNDPASGDILKSEADLVANHWREAAARGFVDEATANEQIQRVNSDAAVAWHVAQTKDKTPDEVARMRASMEQDWKDGKLEGVDARAWAKIDTALQQDEATKRGEIIKADKAVADLSDDLISRAAAGYKIPADEMEKFKLAASKTANGKAAVKDAEDLLDIAGILQSKPLSEAAAIVQKMRNELGDNPTTAQIAKVQRAEAMVAAVRKSLATDPLSHAARAGIIPAPFSLLDVKSPAEMQVAIASRVSAAETVSKHFGIQSSFFLPGEIKALETIAKQKPDVGAELAGGLIAGAGKNAGAVLKEFGTAAPAFSAAGAIIAGGGDPEAATDALSGSAKRADGKNWSTKGELDRRRAAIKFMGDVLDNMPADAERIRQAAEWITRKRLLDDGLEPDAPQAKQIHERALNEAAGAVYVGDARYGGFSNYDPSWWASERKVLVPSSVRADRYYDVIAAVRDDDLARKPAGGVKAMRELYPVLTKDGILFAKYDAQGNPAYLPGEDGKLFVLDLDAIAERVGPRVPGAIRGH